MFISSTFRDMHAERDHLTRVVFPALRERLEKYHIYLDDIDLRWGVTREQAENDQVLDLCLQQIDECRPFFIGILGERYGWVPTRLPAGTLSRQGWVQDHSGKSVTDLEMTYGVFTRPTMRPRAFFYFRDPAALAGMPEEIRTATFAETDPERVGKLAGLKQRIRQGGCPLVDPYPARWDAQAYDRPTRSYGRLVGLEAFGEWVQRQLWEAIQAEHHLPDTPPPETALDPLAVELDYHERFMESRLRVHVGRDDLHRQLLDYALGAEGRPLLVTGPSGSGKSAVLSRACRDLASPPGDLLLVPHFVGASPHSTDLSHTLRRVCLALRDHFRLTDEVEGEGGKKRTRPATVPEDIDGLVHAFRDFARRVPADRRVALVVDAVDQFGRGDLPHLLRWLAEAPPPQVRLVVSCADEPAPSLAERLRLGPFREVAVGGLERQERLEIVRRVPAIWAKTLDADQVDLLLSNPATANPLFLLVALEELRGFGSYERLAQRIGEFPSGGDAVTALFSQVLDRLEEEFDRTTVRRVLSWVAASRSGLSERELRDLLDRAGSPGREDLFPVLRQLRPYTLRRGELIDFFHRNLQTAAAARYLSAPADREAAHRALADLFDEQAHPPGGGGEAPLRALTELPYHLDGAGRDPRAVNRLRELARGGFARQVVERTRDVTDGGRTYAWFFRACLRADDLPGALALAEDRCGLTVLSEWLSTGDIGPLVPYLGPRSPLWQQLRGALLAVGSADDRVGRLAKLTRPGLAPAMYGWLQDQFDRDAPEADPARRREFLRALAGAREGALGYVLDRVRPTGPDAGLMTALVERFEALGRGDPSARERFLQELPGLAGEDVESFVAAAEAFGRHPDGALAAQGLAALEGALPRLADSRFVLCATAALSHALARRGLATAAEQTARRCLDLVPQPSGEGWRDRLYWSSFVEAGVRLALAAAPFPALWRRALPAARALAARAEDRQRQAEALAGFLRVTPWVASPADRVAWLGTVLAEARALAEQGPEGDVMLRLLSLVKGGNPQALLVAPVEEALAEVLADVDRVLPDEQTLEPLQELLETAALLRAGAGEEGDGIWPFFRRVIPSLAGSANPSVVILGLHLYVGLVAQMDLISNDAADVLQSALTAAAQHGNRDLLLPLFEDVLGRVEEAWCQPQPDMYPLLGVAFLRAVSATRQSWLLDAFEDRLIDWQRRTADEYRDLITLQWAACLVALGRRGEADPMLRYARLRQSGGPDAGQMEVILAGVLADAGARDEAAALLRARLPQEVDLGDVEAAAGGLTVARRLLAVAGDDRARRLFVAAARRYRRERVRWRGEEAGAVEEMLLSQFHALHDAELVRQLLGEADQELLRQAPEDAAHGACWYAMLALSSVDEVGAAQALWGELSRWPERHEASAARACLLALVRDAAGAGSSRRALLGELARTLDSITDAGPYAEALRMTARLVGVGPPGLDEDVLRLFVAAARRLGRHPDDLDRAIELLCGRLARVTDGELVARTLEQVLGLLDLRRDPDPSAVLHSAESVLESILGLVEGLPDPARVRRLLELVMRRAVRCNHEVFKERVLARAARHALRHVPAPGSGEVLRVAVEVSDRVANPPVRQELLLSLALAAAGPCTLDDRDGALRALISRLGDDYPGGRAVALAALYQALVVAGTSPAVAGEVAEEVRRLGPPAGTAPRARWAASLPGTPLAPLALQVARELWDDLDRFTAGLDAFRSLGPFLLGLARTWAAGETRERFRRLAGWAVRMPPVCNEDWRGEAFKEILSAAESVDPSVRSAVQLTVLEEAFAGQDGYGRDRLASWLASFSLEEDVAARAVDLYLGAVERSPAGATSRADGVLGLLASVVDRGPTAARDCLLDALCARLDALGGQRSSFERDRLARLAERCDHPGARRRLDAFLEDSYEQLGLGGLGEWDLRYLAGRPAGWWVERSTEARPARASRAELVRWVEHCAGRPPFVRTAVVLASAWLSESEPGALHDFWFDLATSPAPVPPAVRSALAEAAGRGTRRIDA